MKLNRTTQHGNITVGAGLVPAPVSLQNLYEQVRDLLPLHSFVSRPYLLLALILFFLLCHSTFSFGQTAQPIEPRREELLNGLKVLLWARAGESQAMVKLRIHGGAAFDLEGKEGLMAMLGDSFFPDPATRQYVVEDLQGRLDVSTNYDAIDITITGRAAEFERLVELLRNALVSSQITPDMVGRLREARIKALHETGLAPEMVADRAIASRLFGTYPYGRPASGTPESLARIDRADLLLMRERYLNPNNATLVVTGGVEPARAMRAVRQFLGVWRRSEQVIPATFRQPVAPDARPLIVNLPDVPGAEVRLATRGVSRTDRYLAAATVLSVLALERWRATVPELKESASSVRHDSYKVGGIFVMSASVRSASSAPQILEAARKVLNDLAATPVSAAELENAKRTSTATLNKETEKPDAIADAWLDVETYSSPSATVDELIAKISSLTASDLQRVAAVLFRDVPVASVVAGDAAKLRAEISRIGPVEVLGETSTSESNAKPKQTEQPSTLKLKRP